MSVKILHALVLLACTGTAAGAGFERRWTHGLQVQSEPVSGQTAMNGMEFRIWRVAGRDVPALFTRIVADWNAVPGGNAPRFLHQGGWSMVSRIHDGHLQVAQWRAGEAGAELLWSDTDLQATPSAVKLPRYLPAGCGWNGPVHGRVAGRQFLQAAGFCPMRAADIAAELERALREEGWRTRRTPAGLRAGRIGSALEAIVSPTDGRNSRDQEAATVVVVETHEAGDVARRIGLQ